LYEIENSNPTPSEPLTKLFSSYLQNQIDDATYKTQFDSLRSIEEKQAVYTPKLIFAKKMFQNKKKVKPSRKLNFEGDTLELERMWTENGKTCYVVRINNKTENTSYAYAIDQDMRFVIWQGCNGKPGL
jgi:hypothetical protein